MDAYDHFLVVLVYADLAKDFGVSLERMAFLTTVTLIMRPVGAALSGLWADRAGRRVPLLVNVSFYSLVGFACALAPNYGVLLVLRLLCTASGWAASGGSAPRSRWRRSRRPGADSSPASCSRAIRSVTCSPR